MLNDSEIDALMNVEPLLPGSASPEPCLAKLLYRHYRATLPAEAAQSRAEAYIRRLSCAISFSPLPHAVGKPLSEDAAFAISAPIFGGGNRYPSAELKLVRAIERAHGIVTKETGNG